MEKLSDSWLIATLLPFLVQLAALAFGSERGIEYLKKLERWALQKWPALAIRGLGSVMFSLLVAGFLVYGYEVDLVSSFEALQSLDAELLGYLNVIIIAVASGKVHDKIFDPK